MSVDRMSGNRGSSVSASKNTNNCQILSRYMANNCIRVRPVSLLRNEHYNLLTLITRELFGSIVLPF